MSRLILVTKGTFNPKIGIVFENGQYVNVKNIEELKSLIKNKVVISRSWDKEILKEKFGFDLNCKFFKDLVRHYFKENLSRYEMAERVGFKINEWQTQNPIATCRSLWKILHIVESC